MKIPKQLRGKKAEKFEDECILILGVYDLIHWNRILLPLAEFYTQPFTPELIELFEGWEWNQYRKSYMEKGFGMKSEIEFSSDYITIKHHFAILAVIPQKIIKTLADFISACNNSGIELTFKKEQK